MATKLPADARSALQHPYRRQILRALQKDAVKLSPSQLTESGQVPCSLPCAAYHMQVLAESGLVESEESAPVRGRTKRHFSSLVDEGSPISAVLRDTEQSDQQHFALAAS
jgi:predicted ArsR family transcriptional regulator